MNSSRPLNRRDFIKAGAISAGTAGLKLAGFDLHGAPRLTTHKNCIILFLVGGPSQLETFDPKPDAPENVRGPFGTIRTNVPGIDLSENLPRMATIADKYAIVRTVHHTSAPIHETGQQLMQTGRLTRNGVEPPNYGAVMSYLRGPGTPSPRAKCILDDKTACAVVPWPIVDTGVSVGHGQTAGHLGAAHQPIEMEEFGAIAKGLDDVVDRERFGLNQFGFSCHLARRLVEGGARSVTVNMFDTVFNKTTWDCHADGGSLATTLADYRDTLCPMFDTAYAALIEDLEQRGLLDTTLVVAMGEFGRTPVINPRGGRDHWPGCWSVLFAGGGIRGGQVIGASDAWAAEPKDRPVTPAEIAATIYAALGLDPRQTIPGPDRKPIPLADAEPIRELLS
jgi:uncharacterized protein (DUF1501 family)